jgi:hypothetical protein
MTLLPHRVRPHHGVEDRQELTHAGGERDLLGVPRHEQVTIEHANNGFRLAATSVPIESTARTGALSVYS